MSARAQTAQAPKKAVVYIAGPFTASTSWGLAENIRAAERWGLEVARFGAMPLIPHSNTGNFHGLLTPEFWYQGTLELLSRCDGALFIPGWLQSKGSVAEHEWCETNGLPFFGVGHLKSGEFAHWLRTGEEP